MQERKLEHFALGISLIGVLLILFISERIEIDEFTIADINSSFIEKSVKVKGEIVKMRNSNGLMLITLKDQSSRIKVIAFSEDFVDLMEKDFVEVKGGVTEYNGELEIEAKVISLIAENN